MLFGAVHEESPPGTQLPIRHVRSMVAMGWKVDIARTYQNDVDDPERTSAGISCCGSEVGFSPYQIARLSRYDAVS
jgi:hypothetical protein